jgi:hypothetical protein
MSDRLVGRYRLPHVKGQPSQGHAARQDIKTDLPRERSDADRKAMLAQSVANEVDCRAFSLPSGWALSPLELRTVGQQ